jgi:antitoxin component YwqK of YwqJK toxin-antitoxin module
VSFYYQLFLIDNGLYFTWHDNGNVKHIYNYENMKQIGESLEYYENAIQSKKCNYIDGKLTGEFEEWHETGNMWRKCNYENGKRIGLYEQWLSNGKLYIKIEDYSNYLNSTNELNNLIIDYTETNIVDNTHLKKLIMKIIVIIFLCCSSKIIYEYVKNKI